MEEKLTIRLCSPAKINRLLHIIGRREDGYHLLQTLFQFLDFGDTLHFEYREDGKIQLEPQIMMGVSLENNLIYRAASALQKQAQVSHGVNIRIEKRIPLGAGLGGGSSNAATTLVALNHLWDLQWSSSELQALGVKLGADIPIFIHGHAAWGEGIGEKLTNVAIDEPWALVVFPPCQVNTAKIYAHPDLTRNTAAFKIGNLAKDELESLLSKLRNDFEPLVRKLFSEIDDAMKWLSNFGRAQLSGSGASVFACFNSLTQAQEVAQQLPQPFKGFVAKISNQSELIKSANALRLNVNHWGVAKW